MLPLANLKQAPTPNEALDIYTTSFKALKSAGDIRPVVFPYVLYGYFLVGFYLLIPHRDRPWVYRARWLVLASTCWWNLSMLQQVQSKDMTVSFLIGLLNVYGCLWAWKLLIVEKPQWEGRRVQPREGWTEQKKISEGAGNGHADGQKLTEYYWQSYPKTFRERWDWVYDLCVNYRYPGWNYAIPPLPSLPPDVLTKLEEPVTESSKSDVSYVGLRRFDTRKALFKHTMKKLAIYYMFSDLGKTVLMQDPYLILGPNDFPLPPYLAVLPPRVLTFFRQTVCCLTIIFGLDMTFTMAPLLFCIFPALFPQLFTLDLRTEPYYFATHWGTPMYILDKGLPGVWGGFWHHTFRGVFTAPTDYLTKTGYMDSKSMTAKLSNLVFAFGFSGLIHAGGSIAQLPPTKPWYPIVFFALQALGMLLQALLCQVLRTPIQKMPSWVRRVTNLLYVFWWGYMSANLLIDDFARGGLWLHEPVPFSLFRGLGFGYADEGWWCWRHVDVRWYAGRHWWESGIEI